MSLLHDVLRCLPDLVRPATHFGWKHRAAIKVRPDILSKRLPASRALIGAASPPERIRGKLSKTKAEATGQALGNEVIGTVDEQQGTLVQGQRSEVRTVRMRQKTFGGVDDIAERNRLRALRAIYLHDPSFSALQRSRTTSHPDQA